MGARVSGTRGATLQRLVGQQGRQLLAVQSGGQASVPIDRSRCSEQLPRYVTSPPTTLAHLAAIVKHKYLAMLKGRHGAGVHIEVRVCVAAIQEEQGLRQPRAPLVAGRRPPDAARAAMHVGSGWGWGAARTWTAGCRCSDPPILIDVTLCPHALSSTPMDEAVTPLPRPLTTPPAYHARCRRRDAQEQAASSSSRPPVAALQPPFTCNQHIFDHAAAARQPPRCALALLLLVAQLSLEKRLGCKHQHVTTKPKGDIDRCCRAGNALQ